MEPRELRDWESVDFLFQLTEDEVNAGGQGSLAFTGKGKWDGSVIESYLFLAINLKKSRYTRTELAGITRAVNRLFPMPAMLLFQHGHTLTLAIINRRLSRRDESKDVLEKVTLIKDIRFADPHRAHIDILSDLSFDVLHERHDFANFVALHRAWRETLDIQALNRGFFIEIRNWFYWARLHARFPAGAKKDADKRDSEALIRLLTRMIFCWFPWMMAGKFVRDSQTLDYLNRLSSWGVGFRSYSEPYLDSLGVFKDAVLAILACIAKQERIRISERTKAGLERAKRNGATLGRPTISQTTTAQIRELRAHGKSIRQIAKDCGVSVGMVYKAARFWR